MLYAFVAAVSASSSQPNLVYWNLFQILVECSSFDIKIIDWIG